MQKKILSIFLVVALVLVTILSIYIIRASGREDTLKKEIVSEKIEYYTKNYFRFLEDMEVDTTAEHMVISISFVPEVGSFPIKEEIYQTIAYHALEITTFFPEVNKLNYIVLWDDYTKQKVLELTIDEDAIKVLADIFYNEYINQNNGYETSYKRIFSSIIETEESKSWKDTINIYSDTP